MDVLDVVPFVSDRDLALRLLKSASSVAGRSDAFELARGRGYRFTTDDVLHLVKCRRPDLAALVLQASCDMNVLYEVCRESLPVPVLKGVCRNSRTPSDLLLFLYCDSRRSLSYAALSALADRLRTTIVDARGRVENLLALAHCPDEELVDRLHGSWNWRSDYMNYAVTCVLERPGGVSDEVWSLIRGSDWSSVSCLTSWNDLKTLVEHPLITVNDLELILRHIRYRSTRVVVLEALVRRLEANSDAWLEAVVDLAGFAEAGWVSRDGLFAPMSRPAGLRLFESSSAGMAAALRAGCLVDSDVVSFVEEWLAAPSPSFDVATEVFRHPAVRGDLLDRCFERSRKLTFMRTSLASNPNLSEEQQLEMTLSWECRDALAHNRGLSERGAEAVIKAAFFDRSGRPVSRAYVPWTARSAILGVLSNESLPDEVRLGVPAMLVASLSEVPASSMALLFGLLDRRLGSDGDAWLTFLALLPEWDGSLADLVDASAIL